MSFIQKQVSSSKDIGRDLEALRVQCGFDRAQAAHHTKIPEAMIRAWEEGSWNEIDDPVYSERILRSYVEAFGGSASYFLQKYRDCLKEHHVQPAQRSFVPVQRIRRMDLAVVYRWMKAAAFLFVASLLGWYIYGQVRVISSPPLLVLEEPQEGMLLDVPRVHIKGKTVPEGVVAINERPISVQIDGTFETYLDVPRGTTVVEVSARKRHGYATMLTRHVFYDRETSPIVFIATSSTISGGEATSTRL